MKALAFTLTSIFLLLDDALNVSLNQLEKPYSFSPNVILLSDSPPEKPKVEKIDEEKIFFISAKNSVRLLFAENLANIYSVNSSLSNISFSLLKSESLLLVIGSAKANRTSVHLHNWRNRSFLSQLLEIDGIYNDVIHIPGTNSAIIYNENSAKIISLIKHNYTGTSLENFQSGTKKCLLIENHDELLCHNQISMRKLSIRNDDKASTVKKFESNISEILIDEKYRIFVYLNNRTAIILDAATLEVTQEDEQSHRFPDEFNKSEVVYQGSNDVILWDRACFSLRILSAHNGTFNFSSPVFMLEIHSIHISDKTTNQTELSQTYLSLKLDQESVIFLKEGETLALGESNNLFNKIKVRNDYKFKVLNNTDMIMARSHEDNKSLTLVNLEEGSVVDNFAISFEFIAFDFEYNEILIMTSQELNIFDLKTRHLRKAIPFNNSYYQLFSRTTSAGKHICLLIGNNEYLYFNITSNYNNGSPFVMNGKTKPLVFIIELEGMLYAEIKFENLVAIFSEESSVNRLSELNLQNETFFQFLKDGMVLGFERRLQIIKFLGGNKNDKSGGVQDLNISLPYTVGGNFVKLIDGFIINFEQGVILNVCEDFDSYKAPRSFCSDACQLKDNCQLSLIFSLCEATCPLAKGACPKHCPDNCLTCPSESICSYCNRGFAKNGSECVSCDKLFPNCEDCSSDFCYYPYPSNFSHRTALSFLVIFAMSLGAVIFIILIGCLVRKLKLKLKGFLLLLHCLVKRIKSGSRVFSSPETNSTSVSTKSRSEKSGNKIGFEKVSSAEERKKDVGAANEGLKEEQNHGKEGIKTLMSGEFETNRPDHEKIEYAEDNLIGIDGEGEEQIESRRSALSEERSPPKIDSQLDEEALYEGFFKKYNNLINYDEARLRSAIQHGERESENKNNENDRDPNEREGGFGVVFPIIYMNRKLAAKRLNWTTSNKQPVCLEKILDEIYFLSMGLGDFVVYLKYVYPKKFRRPENIYILMEWIDISLFSIIREKRVNLSFSEKLKIFEKLVNGLKHFQMIDGKFLVHGDIKPKNILVLTEGREQSLKFRDVYFADFGEALQLDPSTAQAISKGFTRLYAPPEQLQGNVNKKSDIYSLGLVIWELFFGELKKDTKISIKTKGLEDPGFNNKNENKIALILKKMLEISWPDRPDVDEVLSEIKIIKDQFVEAPCENKPRLKVLNSLCCARKNKNIPKGLGQQNSLELAQLALFSLKPIRLLLGDQREYQGASGIIKHLKLFLKGKTRIEPSLFRDFPQDEANFFLELLKEIVLEQEHFYPPFDVWNGFLVQQRSMNVEVNPVEKAPGMVFKISDFQMSLATGFCLQKNDLEHTGLNDSKQIDFLKTAGSDRGNYLIEKFDVDSLGKRAEDLILNAETLFRQVHFYRPKIIFYVSLENSKYSQILVVISYKKQRILQFLQPKKRVELSEIRVAPQSIKLLIYKTFNRGTK